MPSSPIHVVQMAGFPSFYRQVIPLYVYTTFCLSVHLSMDTWVVSTFLVLWIMLLWMLVSTVVQVSAFSSFRYIPRSRTAGSYSMFNFWGTTILFSIVAKYLRVVFSKHYKSGFDRLFCWLSKFKKVMEKILIHCLWLLHCGMNEVPAFHLVISVLSY